MTVTVTVVVVVEQAVPFCCVFHASMHHCLYSLHVFFLHVGEEMVCTLHPPSDAVPARGDPLWSLLAIRALAPEKCES